MNPNVVAAWRLGAYTPALALRADGEFVGPMPNVNAILLAAYRRGDVVWMYYWDERRHTCNLCAMLIGVDNDDGTLPPLVLGTKHGRNISDIDHHNRSNPRHLRRLRNSDGYDRRERLYELDEEEYDVVNAPREVRWRCMICAVDDAGVPRPRYLQIMEKDVEAHLLSNAHLARFADGRQQLYRQRHQNGREAKFGWELW